MAARIPGPSDFPVLRTVRQQQKIRNGRGYHVCSVCRLVVEPRNSRAHVKACARRKRLNPALWWEWYYDMHDIPENRRTMLHRRNDRKKA